MANPWRHGWLRFRARLQVSLREDSRAALVTSRSGKRVLIVVELDVRLVDQGNVEAEGEIAVCALREHEARAPAVQIALEAEVVIGELLRTEIVGALPARGPIRRRAEGHLQPDHLPA